MTTTRSKKTPRRLRRQRPHRRGVSLKTFVRAALRSVRAPGPRLLGWSVLVYYKGFDMELDQLLRDLIGGKHLGSGTWLETMERDHQFSFPTEKAARAAAARVPWWLRVRVKVKKEPP